MTGEIYLDCACATYIRTHLLVTTTTSTLAATAKFHLMSEIPYQPAIPLERSAGCTYVTCCRLTSSCIHPRVPTIKILIVGGPEDRYLLTDFLPPKKPLEPFGAMY